MKEHEYNDPVNCTCRECRRQEREREEETAIFIHEHRCGLNNEARRSCGQAIKVDGQDCCALKKGCAAFPDEYGEPVYGNDED